MDRTSINAELGALHMRVCLPGSIAPRVKLRAGTSHALPTMRNPRTSSSTIDAMPGAGVRFGRDKLRRASSAQGLSLRPRSALSYERCPSALMVVVVGDAMIEFWRDQLSPECPQARFVSGGDRRQDSVRAAFVMLRRWAPRSLPSTTALARLFTRRRRGVISA